MRLELIPPRDVTLIVEPGDLVALLDPTYRIVGEVQVFSEDRVVEWTKIRRCMSFSWAVVAEDQEILFINEERIDWTRGIQYRLEQPDHVHRHHPRAWK